MAGVKRITRDEISTIRDNEDAWRIIMNPKRPRKRPRLAEDPALPSYIYEQNLDEFDPRLNFHYSVSLYGGVVDWKKKGKGAEKFKTYDKIEYSGISISIGDIVYVNFGDPDAKSRKPSTEDPDVKEDSDDDDKKDTTPGVEAENGEDEDADDEPQEPISDWVAKVLECRAFDEEHVFLRVVWLYRPEDLPSGRKPWHGSNEVFPSNNMQIIDAMAVTDMAKGLLHFDGKRQWVADNGYLVWRQPCKVAVKKGEVVPSVLGKLPTYCVCREPANPDRRLVQCGSCKNWLHDACIEKEAVKRAAAEGLPQSDTPIPDDPAPTTCGLEDDKEEKPTPSGNHFTPFSGTVKLIADQFKRAASPFKHSAAAKLGEAVSAVGDIGKAVLDTITPSTLTTTYSARIVGLELEEAEAQVPLRVEIRDGNSGDDDPPLAVLKIRCLVCQSEIEG